jgi:hypothetical protein
MFQALAYWKVGQSSRRAILHIGAFFAPKRFSPLPNGRHIGETYQLLSHVLPASEMSGYRRVEIACSVSYLRDGISKAVPRSFRNKAHDVRHFKLQIKRDRRTLKQ